ncbi:MAG TPA: slipin family protein [Pirellulaceae bacterium]|jgi:regulator of protease activity HflC (stomatin/prohibitin superfamily)|nr:slipin family protein [Pirellulaceae bacterium]
MAKWIVRQYQAGLLYEGGRFVEVVPPGVYRKWPWQTRHVDVIDVRQTSQTVEGQEILTADKIGVRVTLIAQYRVVDPVVARHAVENYVSQLYQDLQLTLRDVVTGRTLERLMQERDALSQDVLGQVAPRASKYGVDLSRVGVKDLTLPGAVKAVFLQEVEAELKGRASLVAARHEVAAARAKANVGKLLDENPHLMRMQELETLATLASKSGNVIVVPGLDRLFGGGASGPTPPAKS